MEGFESMIEKTKFTGFDAVRLVNEKKDELIVLTEIGPRIISFKPEGKDNFFYVNAAELQQKVREAETWYALGGTRLWISPEVRLTYTPDNSPSETIIENDILTVISPIDHETKLRKTIKIEVKSNSYLITYGLKNEGKYLITAGLWALSCLSPIKGAEIYLPWGESTEWNVKDMKYWRSWLGVGTDIESHQWKPTNEFFIIAPTGEIGKIGFANHWGFALYRAGDLHFVKKTDYVETAHYPDGGCSFEVYTSKEFHELETLSPLYTIKPGITFTHTEHWWAGFDYIEVSSIEKAYSVISTQFS